MKHEKTRIVRPVCRCGRGEVAVTVTELFGNSKVRESKYCRACASERRLVVSEHFDLRKSEGRG